MRGACTEATELLAAVSMCSVQMRMHEADCVGPWNGRLGSVHSSMHVYTDSRELMHSFTHYCRDVTLTWH